MDLSKPIVPAPAGYVVDLENPQRRGEAIITWVGIIGMIIATVLLVIRAFTKLVVVKALASDDCEFRTKRLNESFSPTGQGVFFSHG